MEHKKYYAVKVGIKPGIYETWNECEMQIKGVSGAQYKSFLTLPEAENYINEIESFNSQYKYFRNEIEIENINNQIDNQIENLRSDEVIAFVDGSFNPLEKVSGFGVIIIDNKNVKTSLFKSFTEKDNPDFIELHNVAAELEGVKEAINWAITYNKSYIKIYYDYEGIGKWADESWKANKNITKLYVDFIKEKKSLIDIEFCKVPAHSNVKFNEMADQLAKNSLLQKGYKTYNDGSIYFTDFSIEKWFKIIELLNKEFKEISNENLVKYSITKSDSRQRIEINDSKNKTIINCYLNGNSYVQGKQSALFQKIITLAIESMENGQTVIEILNRINVLSLTKEEIEIKFEQLLPYYNGNRNDKHYNNLLTAIYNTMIYGYMPDYTFLVTPIFRAYEYFLHRILCEKMGLITSDINGRNTFSYFSKNNNGKYECNSNSKSLLSSYQLDYLNNLYNVYNSTRHAYSHWSGNDYDTAVITEIGVAHEYILDGLSLADDYYRLF